MSADWWTRIRGAVALTERLDRLAADIERERTDRERLTGLLDRVADKLTDLQQRVTKLEAQREADLKELRAEIRTFMADLERAQMRQTREGGSPASLPEPPGDTRSHSGE